MKLEFPELSAEEAADRVEHGQTVGFSGFTPAGAAKAIPRAIADRARAEHEGGRPFQIGVVTGASGDFTRNAYISIFTCPSTAKGGGISTIVPLCSHLDHSEHSVQVLVTEQGVADLRGKDPHERAKLIIGNCAHPDFRDDLNRYCGHVADGHTPQTLESAFAMHQQFLRSGTMRGVDWSALKG